MTDTQTGKHLVKNSTWNEGMRGVFVRFPGPVNHECMMEEIVLRIERESRAQERERLREAVAKVESTEPQDYEKDGHHYVIHGGMWWPQDVMDALEDPEPGL